MVIRKLYYVILFNVIALVLITSVYIIFSHSFLNEIHRSWTRIWKTLEKTENDTDQTCKIWNFSQKLKTYDNPQIKLNHDLFLFPDVVGGPNNQIKGLIHAMYLAIRLNRLVEFFAIFQAISGCENTSCLVEQICETQQYSSFCVFISKSTSVQV